MAETPTSRARLFDLIWRHSGPEARREEVHAILDALADAGLAVVPREATDAAATVTLPYVTDKTWVEWRTACNREDYAKMVAAADLLTKED
jgi:hypothetical protein